MYFNITSVIVVGLSIETLVACGGANKPDLDFFDYVDPLIGTINRGKFPSLFLCI